LSTTARAAHSSDEAFVYPMMLAQSCPTAWLLLLTDVSSARVDRIVEEKNHE
jgi:hypothetical protein